LELDKEMDAAREALAGVENEVRKVIVGQTATLATLVSSVVVGGHVLLEGVPGLGKTLMVKTLKEVLRLNYARIQFTPDLMPADITGTNVIDVRGGGAKEYRFEPGPVFTHLLLADEINRASPKTQSALLQAMEEREVTVFGRHFPLEEPFSVIATQNPLEFEGTYPLPEAQLDRFLCKMIVTSPDLQELKEIALRTTGEEAVHPAAVLERDGLLSMRKLICRIPVAAPVLDFAARLIRATHPENPDAPAIVRKYVRYGASPRGLQGLLALARVESVRDRRFHVSREDVERLVLPVLRHRILLTFEAQMEKIAVEDLLLEIARNPGGKG